MYFDATISETRKKTFNVRILGDFKLISFRYVKRLLNMACDNLSKYGKNWYFVKTCEKKWISNELFFYCSILSEYYLRTYISGIILFFLTEISQHKQFICCISVKKWHNSTHHLEMWLNTNVEWAYLLEHCSIVECESSL